METFLIRDLWYNMYTDSNIENLSFGQVSGVSPTECSMSIQSTVHMDWKCSKNRSYAKTICRTSSQAESFAMLHFSHCEKENLVILMTRVRQQLDYLLNSVASNIQIVF